MRTHGVARRAGFTLVEMLVVLALFAILTAFAFPALQMMLARAKLETTVQQTSTLLYSARLQAIRQATTARVDFESSDGRRWAEATLDRNRDDVFESDIGRVEMAKRLDFVGPAGDSDPFVGWTDDRVEFRSDGTLAAPGAVRIAGTVGNALRYYEIRVGPAAAPRISVRAWDPDEAEWIEEGDDE